MMNARNELTPGPWKWEFLGTAGNYYLTGEDGAVTYSGPDSADGKLKQAAPDLLACVEAVTQAVDRHPAPDVGMVHIGLSQGDIVTLRAVIAQVKN